jgi:hypothetical protein
MSFLALRFSYIKVVIVNRSGLTPNFSLFNEIENLYRYRIDIPEIKDLKVHERLRYAGETF